MRGSRHAIYNFRTYRDLAATFGLFIVFGFLYTIGRFYAPLMPVTFFLGVLMLFGRHIFGMETFLSALDCWKSITIFFVWLGYGLIYRNAESVIWPDIIGTAIGTTCAVLNVLTYFRMHAAMISHYEWTGICEVFLLCFYPSMHFLPYEMHPNHFFIRSLLFFTVWTLNDLRIRQNRPSELYADVDAVLLPLQTVWVFFAWMPVVYVLGTVQTIGLSFVVARDSTRDKKRNSAV